MPVLQAARPLMGVLYRQIGDDPVLQDLLQVWLVTGFATYADRLGTTLTGLGGEKTFDSLVEALEHNLTEARAEGHILERLDTARNFFGEDVVASMHNLLHRAPPEQWPTHTDMFNWSGSGTDFLTFLRRQHRDRNAGAEPGAPNGSVPAADGQS